jgi:hypothetical protein
MMRRLFIYFASICSVVLLVLGGTAQAVNPYGNLCQNGAQDSAVCTQQAQQSSNPFSGQDSLVDKIVNILSIAAGIIAVVMVMVGGLQMITSTGDAEKFARGRKTLIFAGIGLLIVLMSRLIIGFVLGKI